MRELRPGIWHWQSPHPDWDEEQWWPQLVSSYGIDLGDDFVLFDPISVPDELRGRATAVVLTAPYHERAAGRLLAGLGRQVRRRPGPRARDGERGPRLVAGRRGRRTLPRPRTVAVR